MKTQTVTTGTSVKITTKYDGPQVAVIMAAVDAQVLVIFKSLIQINPRGDRSSWAWCSVDRLPEVLL